LPLPLFALFLSAFAFGTTEFVIAGILPDVAAGVGVSIPFAGYLVSGYALGIAIGGPLLTIATRHVPRRTILLVLTLIFCLGQVACALAPTFAAMMIFRVFTAVAHGAYFGIAMVVAVSLVPEAFRGRAVSVILAGLTVSNIIGVPAGAAIGALWGWRATFWAMTVIGVLALVAIWALIPQTPSERQASGNLGREVRVLGRQQVWTSLILMLALMIGQMVPFTYITPLLREVTGLDGMIIPWVLLLNGVGATLGVFIGGRLSDWKLMPSLILMLAVQAGVLVIFYLVSPYPWLITVTIFVWGALNFAIGTPIQARILMWTVDAPNLASSLIPSGFNVGIAIAAIVGAGLLDGGYGYRSLPVLGALALVLACIIAILSAAQEKSSGAMPPQAA
jgi:DHA1 family inner membrane transport protein